MSVYAARVSSGSTTLPAYFDMLWPVLASVRDLGHSASIEELDEATVDRMGFTSEQMAVLHKDGPRSEVEYRLAWARTYLKGMGALDNPQRGVWVTTDRGKTFEGDELEPLRQAYLGKLREERKQKKEAAKLAGADAEAD